MTKETEKESTKEISKEMIWENPEKYLEVNMVGNKNNIIVTFHRYIDDNTFKYKSKTYNVKADGIVLIPKRGYFSPTIFYKEGKSNPINFENTNKGIPSRALTLLYDLRLYRTLIQIDKKNVNLILIILNIVSLIMLSAIIYCMYQIETFGFVGW